MASKSSRTITKQQFTDGTTIDGNRIDEAMNDVVSRVNNVRKGDIRRRWLQGQHVLVFSPLTSDPTLKPCEYPFTAYINLADEFKIASSNFRNIQGPLGETNPAWLKDDPTDYYVRNKFRMKGYDGPWLGKIYTSTHIFPNASNIDGLCLINQTEGATYPNYFTNMVFNTVAVLIDNPYSPENRVHNNIILLKKQIDGNFYDKLDTIQDGTNYDMLTKWVYTANPDNSAIGLVGSYFNMENLDRPVPAGARVRLMLATTQYDDVDLTNYTFTATMTYLEEIE